MKASANGHFKVVELLLEEGAAKDLASRTRKETALMLAAARDHPEICELLIEEGANIHLRDAEARTALEIAEQEQSHEAREVIAAAMEADNPAPFDGSVL